MRVSSIALVAALSACGGPDPEIHDRVRLVPPHGLEARDCAFAPELGKVAEHDRALLGEGYNQAVIDGVRGALRCTTLGGDPAAPRAMVAHQRVVEQLVDHGARAGAVLAAFDGAHAARALERDPAGKLRVLGSIYEQAYLELAADTLEDMGLDEVDDVRGALGDLRHPGVELYPTGARGELYRRHRDSGYAPHVDTPVGLLDAAQAGYNQYRAEVARQRILSSLDDARPSSPFRSPDARACDPRQHGPRGEPAVLSYAALTGRMRASNKPLEALATVAIGLRHAREQQGKPWPGDQQLGVRWESRLWPQAQDIVFSLQTDELDDARRLLDPYLDPADDVHFSGRGGALYRANRYGDPLPYPIEPGLGPCAQAGSDHRAADDALAEVTALLYPEPISP